MPFQCGLQAVTVQRMAHLVHHQCVITMGPNSPRSTVQQEHLVMILTTVNSSAIHAIGYDFDNGDMEVIFTGGGIYLFHDVPADLYREFLRADSKGTFFLDFVRGRFDHRRLGRFNRGRLIQRRRYA